MQKPNLFLMMGEDTLSLHEELQRWKEGFREKYGEHDLEELDGENLSLNQLNSSLNAMPFLSEKRLLILKNLLSSQKSEFLNAAYELLKKTPEHSIVVLAEWVQPNARTAAFKAISALSQTKLFLKPKGALRSSWIQKRAEKHGLSIPANLANYLASIVGDELHSIDQEIQKLALYAHGNVPTQEMIEKVVRGNLQESIFTLTEQVAQKNFAKAFEALIALQEQGEDPGFIFAMLVREFRLILEMKALSEENYSPSSMARHMGVHPFVVQNTLRFTKNFTFQDLKATLGRFLELDQRLKTGKIPLKAQEEDPYFLALERILLKTA